MTNSGKAAPVFWFTGLSGSGKTTVAEGTRRRLVAEGLRVLVLDGDAVRGEKHRHLGFSECDIKENNALIVEICAKRRHECDIVLVPIISPYRESRAKARQALSSGFYEIYFAADLAVVTARDTKGLYAKTARGEMTHMIGVSPETPYEPPERADLALDTEKQSPAASADALYQFIKSVFGWVDHATAGKSSPR